MKCLVFCTGLTAGGEADTVPVPVRTVTRKGTGTGEPRCMTGVAILPAGHEPRVICTVFDKMIELFTPNPEGCGPMQVIIRNSKEDLRKIQHEHTMATTLIDGSDLNRRRAVEQRGKGGIGRSEVSSHG